jgi:hypothetical protein
MLEMFNHSALAGQTCGLVALVICVVAFASKSDDRLLVLLISANVAFAFQYIFFQSWTAAALTMLVIARIVLARRYRGSKAVMAGVLLASAIAAAFTWQSWVDMLPIGAMVLGTLGMFLMRGIPMRVCLGVAALLWMFNNLLIGTIGGTIAEGLIVITNIITIVRLARAKRKYPDAFEDPELIDLNTKNDHSI